MMNDLLAGPVATRRLKKGGDNDGFFNELENITDKDPNSVIIMNASKSKLKL